MHTVGDAWFWISFVGYDFFELYDEFVNSGLLMSNLAGIFMVADDTEAKMIT